MRALVLLLALAGCPPTKDRSTNTHSTSISTAAERATFLCAYALCASRVKDAAFHVVFHDNSGGLLAGPDDAEIRAVVSVAPDDLEKWSRGCTEARVEARPEWLEALVAGTSMRPKTAPDGYRCGAELRGIHVKDGLVVRHLSTQ